MKFYVSLLFAAALALSFSAQAGTVKPNLDLEKKIAYQEGQFGALYARCGNGQEKEVIGGSLANWKAESFRGYKGSVAEQAALVKAFNAAAKDVTSDSQACRDWTRQASATWRSIVTLSQIGVTTTANP